MAENIGQRLRIARRDAKLTQFELGDLLGVSGNFISKMENGRAGMPKSMLAEASKVLHISPTALQPEKHTHLGLLEADGTVAGTVCGLDADGERALRGRAWRSQVEGRCPDCADIVAGIMTSALEGLSDIPRCGDIVRHDPSGEEWFVAYATPTSLCAMGSRDDEVPVSACTVVHHCTAAQHVEAVRMWQRMKPCRRRAVVLALYPGALNFNTRAAS